MLDWLTEEKLRHAVREVRNLRRNYIKEKKFLETMKNRQLNIVEEEFGLVVISTDDASNAPEA